MNYYSEHKYFSRPYNTGTVKKDQRIKSSF
jgi:hypothetical protein